MSIARVFLILISIAFAPIANATEAMTGDQIQAEFKKMGNTKTRILVTHDKNYRPLDIEAYFNQIVTPLAKELLDEGNDSTNVTLRDGTTVRMLPVAAGWFELKIPGRLPEANAALAYFQIDGTPGAGFVARSSTGYVFISASKAHKVEIVEGSAGFSMQNKFISFDRLEFDLPKDFKTK
jgi:hypothetical protein